MESVNTANIFLPLNVNQIFDLVKQLPNIKKKELAKLLKDENIELSDTIPNAQKKFVKNSIKKYEKHPELLLSNHDAWELIDKNDL